MYFFYGIKKRIKLIFRRFHSRKHYRLETVESLINAGKYANAFNVLKILSDQGNSYAQYQLAKFYEEGRGTLQNYIEAEYWYLKSASQGSSAAQNRLGEIYLTGLTSTSTASPSALKLFQASDNAESLIRRISPKGLSIARDIKKAAYWNSIAALAGDSSSQARYGYQLATGCGVDKDLESAEKWFKESVLQHNVAGYLGLGLLYSGGFGGYQCHGRHHPSDGGAGAGLGKPLCGSRILRSD